MTRLIGIAGGIGSGKSVVSRILRCMGQKVYDCDLRAKILMNTSTEIKCAIRDEISAEVTDGISEPDRKLLAEIVFGNEKSRLILNRIVHRAVREDLKQVTGSLEHKCLFVEAAILAESGLAEMCDSIWKVENSSAERIERVMKRDGIDRQRVLNRIRSQENEAALLRNYSFKTIVIYNDSDHSLISQISELTQEEIFK